MYRDLHELLMNSSSTRAYFMSLPVEVQMELHEANDHLRTAEQLRRHVSLRADLPRFPQVRL